MASNSDTTGLPPERLNHEQLLTDAITSQGPSSIDTRHRLSAIGVVRKLSTSGDLSPTRTHSAVETGGASADSELQPLPASQKKSLISRAVNKTTAVLSRVKSIPGSESEVERVKVMSGKLEWQWRKHEYERLGLADKTQFGTPGAGGWSL